VLAFISLYSIKKHGESKSKSFLAGMSIKTQGVLSGKWIKL